MAVWSSLNLIACNSLRVKGYCKLAPISTDQIMLGAFKKGYFAHLIFSHCVWCLCVRSSLCPEQHQFRPPVTGKENRPKLQISVSLNSHSRLLIGVPFNAVSKSLVVGEAGCQGMGRKHFWRTTCRSI